MLIIKTSQPNTLVVTVSQNSELTNPEYLFSFTHIFSKEQINFIPVDISTHKSRYDEFFFVEGNGVGEIRFPYQGQYLYVIYEQPAGSGNLIPSLATNVVENGDAQVFPSSASTMGSQYDIFISNNEDNSNFIFAPDEIIPPTPSASPIPPSPTPTPTPTPTPGALPTPSSLGALWWIDFTDASTLTFDGSFPNQTIASATDKISNVVFTATTGQGPNYNPTGYLGISGDVRSNAAALNNPPSTYGSITECVWFGRLYDDGVSQRGGKIMIGTGNDLWPFGQLLLGMFDAGQPTTLWRFQSSGGNIIDGNITYSAWTNIAIRSYQSGLDAVLEVWENGSIIYNLTNTNTIIPSRTDCRFGLMWDGGIDFSTEQFFFDRNLTTGEMNTMFNYLNTKY